MTLLLPRFAIKKYIMSDVRTDAPQHDETGDTN